MSPFVSDAQRRWGNSPAGIKALGGKAKVTEWNNATKGRKLPEHVKTKKMAKKNWIAGAIKHPGALKKSLGVKSGKKIPKGKLKTAVKKKGKIGARARLAMTLSKFH